MLQQENAKAENSFVNIKISGCIFTSFPPVKTENQSDYQRRTGTDTLWFLYCKIAQ